MAPSTVRRGWCRAPKKCCEQRVGSPITQRLCMRLGEPERRETEIWSMSSQPLCHTSSSPMHHRQHQTRRESGLYPHRRHPEGPAVAAPLLFHQHLVDTAGRGLPGGPRQAAPQGTAALQEGARRGLGRGRNKGSRGSPPAPFGPEATGPVLGRSLGCLPHICFSKTMPAEAKRAGSLHTHQRVPQQPWFSPSPLTFSVFTDSVSLVGMLAVGRRKRFRWHTGGAARPGGREARPATRQTPWEPGRRATKGPQGLDQHQEALRSEAPPQQESLCFHNLPGKPRVPTRKKFCPSRCFPRKVRLNPVTALGTSLLH